MTLSPSSESTTHLGHYGLIAGVFDELGISDLIDALLPKKSGHNIPHSTVLKAMCINGLGFTERRLYLFPAFFENLPTERLLGEGVLPEHLNDDVFGRILDKIQEYGATELFNHIILQAMKHSLQNYMVEEFGCSVFLDLIQNSAKNVIIKVFWENTFSQ